MPGPEEGWKVGAGVVQGGAVGIKGRLEVALGLDLEHAHIIDDPHLGGDPKLSLQLVQEGHRCGLVDLSRGEGRGELGWVDPRLLEVLVCPVTRGKLTYDRERQELVSKGAKLAFPIRDGVPIMLPEEARALD